MRAGVVLRTATASVLLAIVVGAVFAILLRQIDTFRESGRAVTHTRNEFTIVDRLEKLVIDLETGVRGFAITGQERFLEPWSEARSVIPEQTRRLAALVDTPDQARRVRALTRDIDSYVEDYSLPLVVAVRRDSDAGLSVAVTAEGKRRVDAIRGGFARFREVERARLTERQERDDIDAARATTVATVALGVSVVLILLFGGYLTRAIAVPLRGAAAMAGRLAGGDLSVRLPETGIGEVGALERAFNRMGSSLEANRDELQRLADEQAALRRVATLVARDVPSSELFRAVAAEVGTLFGADHTALIRFEDDDTVGDLVLWVAEGEPPDIPGRGPVAWLAATIVRTGRPARQDRPPEERQDALPKETASVLRTLGIRSVVGSPILVAGRVSAALFVSSKKPEPLPADTEARLSSFTELVATAVANAEARAELVDSRARLVAAGDDARRQVVRDLHDGSQQRLVHTIITLKLARRAQQAGDDTAAKTLIGEALEQAEDANTELRELAHGILPAALVRGGLAAGVDALVSRVRLPVRVEVPEERFPPEIEASAYFVVAEALTNVAKHSGAATANVTGWVDDGVLHVDVRDDGVGGARPDGSGLLGLHDRVAALGGRLRVESQPGSGTRIAATLPLSP